MSVTALFGGTFNPFHIGHYEMLKHLCGCSWIERVFVMPDRLPPHKECDFLASDEDRINICRIAADDFQKAELCLIEFEREGKSYSIDTVRELKKRFSGEEFYFVCGGDMLSTLDTWKSWEQLIKEVKFIVFARKGLDSFEQDLYRMRSKGADITVLEEEIPQISSSQLRKKLNPEMLPKGVYDYILARKIYNE